MGVLNYGYDALGMRASVSGSMARTGLPQPIPTASYDGGNELLAWNESVLSYDSNGNMLSDGMHNYAWDARNHLSTIDSGSTGSFVYDPAGRRATKVISGTGTNFLYDLANPVQELSGTTPTANLLTGGLDEYFTRTDSSGMSSFLTDALGSTAGLADGTGAVQSQYTFDPFGNTTTSGSFNTNTFAYTGRESDGTGLYYYRARYYNPAFGRFISEDPIGLAGGINEYAYAYDNPVNNSDASGLCSDPGGSGTRYCIEAYIPDATANAVIPSPIGPITIPFSGDDRGPDPSGGTYRFHQDFGSLGAHSKPGNSLLLGVFPQRAAMKQCDITPMAGRKGKKTFRAQASGSDGWLFGAAPNAAYDLTITETDSGVDVTGSATLYPSLEVWQYSDGGGPNLVYSNQSGLGPYLGPPSLILPKFPLP